MHFIVCQQIMDKSSSWAPADQGDKRSSGLQNWQAEAPVTGCQFIGHHLVSRWGGGGVPCVSGGSLQVTALPLEHTYSFHMELLLHPACTIRFEGLCSPSHPMRSRSGGSGDARNLGRQRSRASTLTPGLDASACRSRREGVLWPDNFLLPALLPQVNGIIAHTPTARPKGQGLSR